MTSTTTIQKIIPMGTSVRKRNARPQCERMKHAERLAPLRTLSQEQGTIVGGSAPSI
jgi:hypothetical protein